VLQLSASVATWQHPTYSPTQNRYFSSLQFEIGSRSWVPGTGCNLIASIFSGAAAEPAQRPLSFRRSAHRPRLDPH
jgi:hypothetical protein